MHLVSYFYYYKLIFYLKDLKLWEINHIILNLFLLKDIMEHYMKELILEIQVHFQIIII